MCDCKNRKEVRQEKDALRNHENNCDIPPTYCPGVPYTVIPGTGRRSRVNCCFDLGDTGSECCPPPGELPVPGDNDMSWIARPAYVKKAPVECRQCGPGTPETPQPRCPPPLPPCKCKDYKCHCSSSSDSCNTDTTTSAWLELCDPDNPIKASIHKSQRAMGGCVPCRG